MDEVQNQPTLEISARQRLAIDAYNSYPEIDDPEAYAARDLMYRAMHEIVDWSSFQVASIREAKPFVMNGAEFPRFIDMSYVVVGEGFVDTAMIYPSSREGSYQVFIVEAKDESGNKLMAMIKVDDDLETNLAKYGIGIFHAGHHGDLYKFLAKHPEVLQGHLKSK